jgi:hypothetical protein
MELYNHLELLLEMLHSAADKLVPTFPCRKETKLGRNTQNIYLKHRYLLNKNVMIISRSMRSMNVKDYLKWLSMNNSLLRDVFGYPMQCKHLPFCPLYDVANLISTICQFQCRLFYIHVCKRSNHEYGHSQ